MNNQMVVSEIDAEEWKIIYEHLQMCNIELCRSLKEITFNLEKKRKDYKRMKSVYRDWEPMLSVWSREELQQRYLRVMGKVEQLWKHL